MRKGMKDGWDPEHRRLAELARKGLYTPPAVKDSRPIPLVRGRIRRKTYQAEFKLLSDGRLVFRAHPRPEEEPFVKARWKWHGRSWYGEEYAAMLGCALAMGATRESVEEMGLVAKLHLFLPDWRQAVEAHRVSWLERRKNSGELEGK